jgi:hypothetical protein
MSVSDIREQFDLRIMRKLEVSLCHKDYNLGYALPSKDFCNQDYVTRATLLKCMISQREIAVPHKSVTIYHAAS